MAIVPALRRLRQDNPCEFEPSLAAQLSTEPERTAQRDPVSENKTKQTPHAGHAGASLKKTGNAKQGPGKTLRPGLVTQACHPSMGR